MTFFRLLIIGPQTLPTMQKPLNLLRRTLGCRCPAKWTSSNVDGLIGDGRQTSWQGGSCQVHSLHRIRNDAQFPDCCSSTRAKIFGSLYWHLPIWLQIASSEGKLYSEFTNEDDHTKRIRFMEYLMHVQEAHLRSVLN